MEGIGKGNSNPRGEGKQAGKDGKEVSRRDFVKCN